VFAAVRNNIFQVVQATRPCAALAARWPPVGFRCHRPCAQRLSRPARHNDPVLCPPGGPTRHQRKDRWRAPVAAGRVQPLPTRGAWVARLHRQGDPAPSCL